jgi:hypothetical protein
VREGVMMIDRMILLALALAAAACGRSPEPTAESVEADRAAAAEALNVVGGNAAQSAIPAVVPLPKDQADLDRMILAGYTPHADHLHAPGVNSCPLTKGNDAVM